MNRRLRWCGWRIYTVCRGLWRYDWTSQPFCLLFDKIYKKFRKKQRGYFGKNLCVFDAKFEIGGYKLCFFSFFPIFASKILPWCSMVQKGQTFPDILGTFTQGRKYGILFMSLDVESLSVNPVCGKKIFLIRLLRFYRGSLCCLARFSRARWNMASFCCFLQLLSSTRPHGSKYGYLLRRKGNGWKEKGR